MRTASLLLAFLALVGLTSPLAGAQAPARFYVATGGNDAWSGTLAAPNAESTDGPFATLARARDAVRQADKSSGAEVILRGGLYEVKEPLVLGAEDSGAENARVVWRAADGEEARLTGGVVVPAFAPVTDAAVLDRLEESARGAVVQADLKALGITDFGTPEGGGAFLYFKGLPMTLSRWPNDGFVNMVDVIGGDTFEIRGNVQDRIGRWVYEGDRPSRWLVENDAWVHGYWCWDWSDQRHKVKSIDPEQHVMEVEPPYHGYGYRKGQWYYAFNLLSEIDMPGEWYIDRESGVLYFWPPEPAAHGDAVVSVLANMVTMNEASCVTFQGIVIEGLRGRALAMTGGRENLIADCTFRNSGEDAASVSGGLHHGVTGCEIYNMAGGGISISGGDRAALSPANHYAVNNHIHDYGRWYRMYRSGISVHGVGNRVANNLIHDAPHMGIMFGGNDHVIELNEIHNVCLESNDAGAMYAGRDWTMRGTVIRNNYLHDITGFRGHGCVGVYLDDMYCGTEIVGNIFYRVTMAAFIGGGRDCSIVNNLFVDCNPALHIDARAMGWAHEHGDMWIEEGKTKGTLSGIAYNKPPYSERYPALVNILEEEPKSPRGNVIARNVCIGGKWDTSIEEVAKQYLTFENNFVDTEGIGFTSIPIENIGLLRD